ncbi:MAG: hypothetical protein AAFY60_12560, partial [Myxococcota bacterium]
MASRHFESLLLSAGREETKAAAEDRVRSHLTHLRRLRDACAVRLHEIQAYVEELRSSERGTMARGGPADDVRCEALVGEWHFLYMPGG